MPVALVFVPEEGGGVLNKGPNAGWDKACLGQKMESALDGRLWPEALMEVWVAGDRRLSLRG